MTALDGFNFFHITCPEISLAMPAQRAAQSQQT
jgi:hypothetical protein